MAEDIIELDDDLNPKTQKEEVIELDENLNPITSEKKKSESLLNSGDGDLESTSTENISPYAPPSLQSKPEALLSRKIDKDIINVSRKWNESEKALGIQSKELENYENQLNDPMVGQDVKDLLIPEYNALLENSKKTQAEFDKTKSSAIELQKAKATLGKIDKVQAELEAKKTSMGEDLYKSFERGSQNLGAMIARTPAFIYDVAAIPQNKLAEYAPETFGALATSSDKFAETNNLPDNKVAEFYESAAKESQEKIALKYDKGITDYFSNGEYSNGFKLMANQVAESLPISLSLMVGGAAGLGSKASIFGGGAVFGAGKKEQLDKESDLKESEKTLNALSTGLMEGLFEQYGITKLGGVVKDVFEREGAKVAKDIAKEGFKEVYAPVLKKYTGVAAEEMTGEMATQFTQNAIDKYSGVDPNKDLMDGVIDAGLVGLGASTTFSVPVSVADLAKTRKENKEAVYKQALEVKGDVEKINELRSSIDKEVENKDITQAQGDALKEDINSAMKMDERIPDSIKKTERRVEAVKLLAKKDKLEADIEGKDKSLTIKQREQIDEINIELEALASGKPIKKEEPKVKPVEEKLTQELTSEEKDELEVLEGVKENLGDKITKADNQRLIELKSKQDALQIGQAADVLQRESGKTGEPGSERGALESGVKGNEVTNEGEIQTEKEKEISPEKQAFIDKEIKGLKKSGDYNSDFDHIYSEYFNKQYEIQTQKQNEATGIESEPAVKAIEQKEGPTDIKGADEQIAAIDQAIGGSSTEISQGIPEKKAKRIGNRVPKKLRKLSEKAKKALAVETTSAYDRALQFFINKGSLHPSAIESLYGEKSGKEKQARLNILFKEGKTIDQIAHSLWEANPEHDTMDYRNAVEQVVNEHNSTGSMMDDLLTKHKVQHEMSTEEKEYYDKLDAEDKPFIDEVLDYWEELTDEEKDFIANESEENIEKFISEETPATKSDLQKIAKEKQSEAASAENKYQKSKAALEEKGQQDQIDIFGKTKAEENLFKEDLTEARKIVDGLKKVAQEAKLEASKAQSKVDNFVEPSQLSIADQIRAGKLKGDAMASLPGFKQAWNASLEVIAKAVEAGVAIKEAIEKGIAHLKETEYYKSKGKKAQDTMENSIRERAAQVHKVTNEGKVPSESAGQRVKSLATELSQAENIPKELQDKIKEFGLKGEIFTHKEAKDIANAIIESEGVEFAVDMANKKLKGSVKAFVYGAAIDYYAQKIKEAKTQEEKELYAELGSDVSEMFESNAEDYGRFISAIGEYYKNHPDIIKKRILKKLAADAEALVKSKEATDIKIKAVQKELNDLKEEFDKKLEAGVQEEFTKVGEKLFGKEDTQKVNDIADDLIAQIKAGTYGSLVPPIVLVGAINTVRYGVLGGMGVANAIQAGIQYVKDNFSGKFDEKELRDTLNKTFGKAPSSTQKAQSNPKTPKVKSLKEQQEAILNKYFPKKRTEDAKKRKQLHEKIIDQYNNGVFEGGVNKDGETFESLFYEKLGIINPNSPEVKAKIGEFADKMGKAPEGSIMWRETNQDMLNYLAKIAYENMYKSTGNVLASMWYANILSSPATHLRNTQFNIVQAMIAQPLLMAQKAILTKGDFKAAVSIYANLFRGLAKGLTESGRVIKTGRGTRFDNITEASITDRNKVMKFFALPGRALRASDILFTDAGYNSKMGEVARNMVKAENPTLSSGKVNTKVNDLLNQSTEKREAARMKAEKELEEFYGPDWRNEKDIKTIQKIREYELMEESMSPELKKEQENVKNWAKRSMMTNHPPGIYGQIADVVQKMNTATWFTKFVIPFVNVPLNVVNGIIERSPFGLVKALKGKEGFGKYATELTKDQKQELFIKAANYTIMIALLAMINGDDEDDDFVITGDQTGNYTDNKGIVRGGKLEPYSVYVDGKKVLNYKTTPWAAMLLPAGYARDYKVYGENKSTTEGFIDVVMNYMLFINETSAMQGVAGMFETVSKVKDAGAVESIKKSFAKLVSGFIPYSGAVKYVTNTINAATGEKDKRPIDWYENIYRDIPFAQVAIRTRKDHFGVPVKESFDIPLLPVGDRGVLAEISEKSPYYKLTSDHKYNPHWTKNRKFVVNGEVKDISMKELDDLNVRRGELVKDALDSKNIFVVKPKGDQEEKPSKESQMTTMEYLDGLDNDEFKAKMDDLFNEATKYAKLEMFGSAIGISKKDLEKFKKKLDFLKSEGYTPEELKEVKPSMQKTQEKEMEAIKNKGVLTIEVEDY